MSDRIRLTEEDLFTPRVDELVARQQALRALVPPLEPTSFLRSLLYSSLFFLAVAGALGGCLGWLLIEPLMNEAVDLWGTIESSDLPTVFAGEGRELRIRGLLVLADDQVTRVVGEGEYAGIAKVDDLEVGQPVMAQCMLLDVEQDALLATRIVVRAIPPEHADQPQPDLRRLAGFSLVSGVLGFAMVGACVAGCTAAADGLVSRNLRRGLTSGVCGVGIAAAGGLIGLVPGGIVFALTTTLVTATAEGLWTSDTLSGLPMLILVVGRSLTWGILGLTVGLGQGVALRSKSLFVNGLLGGLLGGLIGGTLFDPIARLLANTDLSGQAVISRGFGFTVIGLSAGLMIGLVEHLAKDAWLMMRAGPLTGKEFILHKSPTVIGSSPKCEIYLFKDPDVEPRHATIVKVGSRHEIQDQGGKVGTVVNGQRVSRQALQSGDQIVIGATVLEYVERLAQGV